MGCGYLRGDTMSALNHAIKTNYTLYYKPHNEKEFMPIRYADCSVVGTTETLKSEILLPNTRVQGASERGSQSSAGDINTEWNIDEQDYFLSCSLCNDWKEELSIAPPNQPNPVIENKTLVLSNKSFCFELVKEYTQVPKEFQVYKDMYINQLQIDFAKEDFVKLGFSLMGGNDPQKEKGEFSSSKKGALTTKAFHTLKGFLHVGDIGQTPLPANRQCSDLSLTINNNLEKTTALFETEAIEQSLGDFTVEGSMGIYNSDNVDFYNDAVAGKEKQLQIQVQRVDNHIDTTYTIDLKVKLEGAEESKDGNKLKYTVKFSMIDENGIKITKLKRRV